MREFAADRARRYRDGNRHRSDRSSRLRRLGDRRCRLAECDPRHAGGGRPGGVFRGIRRRDQRLRRRRRPTQALAIAAARGYTNGVNNTQVTVTCNSSASTYTVRIDRSSRCGSPICSCRPRRPPRPSAVAQLASRVSDLCVLALDGTNVSAAIDRQRYSRGLAIGNTTLNLRCGIAVDFRQQQPRLPSAAARR